MTRRKTLGLLAAVPAIFLTRKLNLFAQNDTANSLLFDAIIQKAKTLNWHAVQISDLMIKIGKEFIGTPYKGGTLEGTPEECRIDLAGLDCVTFYEYCLALSRMIQNEEYQISELYKQLTFMRYRDGILLDYSSRLHYTSDWFYDNDHKSVASDITKDLGGENFDKKINFMSTHPQYYSALKDNTAMVSKISAIEDAINSRDNYYIPQENIAEVEPLLNSGDIIGITSSIDGLDYNHTGLAYRDELGVLRLFHASSEHKKVLIGERLSDYVLSVKKHTGISVLRPIDVRK